ncbi:MAG: hypothetical protein PHV20_07625 [Bacteroidales bacterium]|nr:hypothetical protein [Bacteroidales bacterium]
MSFLSNLLGGGAGKLVDSVGNTLDKLTTSKEEVLQIEQELKKAEMQYRLEMQHLTIEEQKASFADTDSARKRSAEVETNVNASWLSKNVSALLATGTTILTFILFYLLIFQPNVVSDKAKDIIIYVLGVLSAIITQVFSFYFGSSQGSVDKGRTIDRMTK